MTGSFLYPFLDAEERDAAPLLADLAASADAKAAVSSRLRVETLERQARTLDAAADALADVFTRGGRLLVAGNGGSSTDAAGIASLFAAPPYGGPLPARSLVTDPAVLTALSNDVGFDVVFARQVLAFGKAGDALLGVSTSGGSANVLRAFAAARGAGLLTLGLAGYGGGAMAASGDVDHCLVVSSDSVHRTQETQAALAVALWRRVQDRLAKAVAT
ncbi:MAG: SIS domain-containing protein [Actinomycetota bacterium]|nr:SIS domain-containing protein [Actinomycetota bacterium]